MPGCFLNNRMVEVVQCTCLWNSEASFCWTNLWAGLVLPTQDILWFYELFRIFFISVGLNQFSCSPILMAFRDSCFILTKASVCAALPLDLPVFLRMCLISCCGLVQFQDCLGKLASNAVWSSGRIEFWAFFFSRFPSLKVSVVFFSRSDTRA